MRLNLTDFDLLVLLDDPAALLLQFRMVGGRLMADGVERCARDTVLHFMINLSY